MELFVKIVIVAVYFLAGVIAFIIGWINIQRAGDVAKGWVDLFATCSGAVSFVAAVAGLTGLLKLYKGNWLLDYPLIGKPTVYILVVPLFLAIGLGLSLAKRLSDVVRVRKI